MNTAIAMAWAAIQFLQYAGVLVMVAGVAVFGRNLLRTAVPGNDQSNDVLSPAIWRADAAQFAFRLFAGGFGLLLLSIAVAAILPTRP